MQTKILIVNNGLKDLRGHYFETGVAVATAALEAGLQVFHATNVRCPEEIHPKEIPFLPVCRTDHWMSNGPAFDPGLSEIRPDPTRMSRVTIDAVISREASFSDYLTARLTPALPPSPPEVAPVPVAVPSREKHGMKSLVRGLIPPIVWSSTRAVLRGSAVRGFVRNVLPPLVVRGAKWGVRKIRSRLKPPVVADPMPVSPVCIEPIAAPSAEEKLAAELGSWEYGNTQAYEEDLLRLLGLTGVGAGDHVFIPTAHGRELLAVRRVIDKLEAGLCPTFHLEFRHALDLGDDLVPAKLGAYAKSHSQFFELFRRFQRTDKIRNYTDTDCLTVEYARLSGLKFETLPIPFRLNQIGSRGSRTNKPLVVAFLGDARDEKGYQHLPRLVAGLSPEAEAGQIRFVFQSNVSSGSSDPRSVAARNDLQQLGLPYVELPGLSGPLHPAKYYEILSDADILVCPYDPVAYHRRSSGTLTEAVAAGIPTVVPAGTWLAKEQPVGTGRTFDDPSGLTEAVRNVVGNYATYASQAIAYKDQWQAVHNPANLVAQLLRPAA